MSVRRWLGVAWLISVLVLALAVPAPAAETRSVAGSWRVQLDPTNVGEAERWFDRELPATITLPGSIDEARLAPPNAAPPSLDGLYRLHPYEGAAWYQYDLMIPGSWKGKRVSLVFERVHWETRVWVDGQPVPGTQDSLVAPHVHDLGPLGSPGTKRVTVRVDNTRKLDLGGFVSILYEGTQTNWNGLIGRMELRAVDPVSIEDLRVDPDVANAQARVRLRLSNATGQPARGEVRLAVRTRSGGPLVAEAAFEVEVLGALVEVDRVVPMGPGLKLWDEFAPNVYLLNATLTATAGAITARDEQAVRFGMRSVGVRGTQVTVNNRPIQLRGTLDCAIYPRTGYPPTDPASWRRIFRIVKAHGLNFVRFHSWCPPEAAFAAADAEGVYLQPEGPQANVQAGEVPARDAFIEAELSRIIRTYGNHPSFLLMTLGNEYGGNNALLSRWIDGLRSEDPRHLYASPAAGQATPNRQFTEGGPRGVQGPGTAHDFRKELAAEDRPLLGHEIGQWTVFPDFGEIPKYDGVLAARNFEMVRADLERKGLLDLAPRFVQATGRHAALLYKEEIEVLLRTPRYAGFSLLDLHDYPGQGTALVGLLDPFWDSKGLVTPEEHARYCGPTVPLLRLPKRTYTTDEPFVAGAEVSHTGSADLPAVEPVWTIRDSDGREVASGHLPTTPAPAGELTCLGEIQADLSEVGKSTRLTVELALKGTSFVNRWDIWAYPPVDVSTPPSLLLARAWDEQTKAALAAGQPVLLLPGAVNVKKSLRGRFLPVFWSPVWFPNQKPNTMGLLCDPGHPALAGFPTEFHSNWQWYELLDHSRSLILDDAPAGFRPVVQVIDNFARNHLLGNLFEARVGSGRLLVCTIDLTRLSSTSPAARQLLASLTAYASSPRFQPSQTLELAYVDGLLQPASNPLMDRLGARIVRADSEQSGFEAAGVLDDDPETMWHTTWGDEAAPFPHELVVALREPATLAGIVCQPRQDQSNGWIRGYRVETSTDGKVWSLAAEGEFDRSDAPKTIAFPTPAPVRYLKFVARSGFDTQPFASLADLSVLLDPPLARSP